MKNKWNGTSGRFGQQPPSQLANIVEARRPRRGRPCGGHGRGGILSAVENALCCSFRSRPRRSSRFPTTDSSPAHPEISHERLRFFASFSGMRLPAEGRRMPETFAAEFLRQRCPEAWYYALNSPAPAIQLLPVAFRLKPRVSSSHHLLLPWHRFALERFTTSVSTELQWSPGDIAWHAADRFQATHASARP